jgi:hypothetical protein
VTSHPSPQGGPLCSVVQTGVMTSMPNLSGDLRLLSTNLRMSACINLFLLKIGIFRRPRHRLHNPTSSSSQSISSSSQSDIISDHGTDVSICVFLLELRFICKVTSSSSSSTSFVIVG